MAITRKALKKEVAGLRAEIWSWRKHFSEVRQQRDDARSALHRADRERDELRAEVERLRNPGIEVSVDSLVNDQTTCRVYRDGVLIFNGHSGPCYTRPLRLDRP